MHNYSSEQVWCDRMPVLLYCGLQVPSGTFDSAKGIDTRCNSAAARAINLCAPAFEAWLRADEMVITEDQGLFEEGRTAS